MLVGGYDVMGTVTKLTDKQTAKTERTDGLGDAWEENSFVGVREAMITQEGFYDDAVGSVHAALSSGPGNTTQILCYGPDGTATGAFFKGMTAVQVDYEVDAARGALHKAHATYKSNGRFDNGRVLYTHKASAGTSAETGNSVKRVLPTGVTSTASSSGGGAGYFQLSAFASGANATGVRSRIQHSSDNAVWADLITFTIATAAPFAQRVELGATIGVEAWVRMNTTFQGGSTASMTGFWGFARY